MQRSTLTGRGILFLREDRAYLSRAAHTALEGAGAHVFPASTAADALHVVEEVKTLGRGAGLHEEHQGRPSDRAAARCTLNIPFVFCKEIGCNEAWLHASVLNRPVNTDEPIETLRRLLERTAMYAPRRERSCERVSRRSKEPWP